MSVLSEDIKNEISRNPAIFESQILSCFIGSHVFFLANHQSVCEVLRNGKRRQDFSKNWMNVLFEGIVNHWSVYEAVQEEPIPRVVLDMHLNTANDEGRLLDSELGSLEAALENVYALTGTNLSSTLEFVESGVLGCWLGVKLTSYMLSDLSSRSIVTSPEELLNRVTQIRERQLAHDEDDGIIVTVRDAIRGNQTRGELIHTPFPALDEKVGGGFAKKEHTLIASVTGGGKTVMATQLASTFARQGHRVILVTTEEDPGRLMYRMYSDIVDIPYQYFTQGQITQRDRRQDQPEDNDAPLPDMVRRDTSWVTGIREFQEVMMPSLTFLNWTASRKTVEDDLVGYIHKLRDHPELQFDADILIFDWIGAAISRNKKQSMEVRHLYEAVANELKYIAVNEDLSVFSFAQLNKVQAKGKRRCDHTMLHESKAIADQAVNALYISGLTNNNDEDEGAAFLSTQWMNVAKSRFGEGGLVPLIRQFGNQRFSTPDRPR